MEMKEILHREGRDAKNLLVYQCHDTPPQPTEGPPEKAQPPTHRRPPVAPAKTVNSNMRPTTPKSSAHSPARSAVNSQSSGPRVRSASTGRDKRSELQARYWALLFGNLQRAVNEIYQTVECYENLSSCKEAILVLENYVRDFKALSEWFKVSWDYESRPLQQKPHSLAWEVRKSNPMPRLRARSLSSPTGMGKSSPCPCSCASNSGKNSPCCGGDNQSPRKVIRTCDQLPKGTMRVNVRELFAANKRPPSEQLMDQSVDEALLSPKGSENESSAMDKPASGVRHQYAQTDLEDDHLTLADIRERDGELEMQLMQEQKDRGYNGHEETRATPPPYEDSITLTNSPNVSYSPHILIVPTPNYTHIAASNGLNYATYCAAETANGPNYQYGPNVTNYSHVGELPNGPSYSHVPPNISNAQNFAQPQPDLTNAANFAQRSNKMPATNPTSFHAHVPQPAPFHHPTIACNVTDVNYTEVPASYCSTQNPNEFKVTAGGPGIPAMTLKNANVPLYTNAPIVANVPLFSVPPPAIYQAGLPAYNQSAQNGDKIAYDNSESAQEKVVVAPKQSGSSHSKTSRKAGWPAKTTPAPEVAKAQQPENESIESKESAIDPSKKSLANGNIEQTINKENTPPIVVDDVRLPTAVEMTVQKLNTMENELLLKDSKKGPTPPSTELQQIKPAPVAEATGNQIADPRMAKEDATLKPLEGTPEAPAEVPPASAPETSTSQSVPLKYSSVLNRPAGGQRPTTKTAVLRQNANAANAAMAMAKPAAKLSAGVAAKSTVNNRAAGPGASRVQSMSSGLNRVVGTRPNPATVTVPTRPSSKTENYGPPTNVASRISARSRTMLDINGTTSSKNLPLQQRPLQRQAMPGSTRQSQTNLSSRKSSREDVGSSTSTLKASNSSLANAGHTIEDRHSEPKQMPSDANDGWLTVKNRRRSSLHWASRFNQPTGYASLPTLALLNEQLEEEKEQQQKKLQQQQQKKLNEAKSGGSGTSLAAKQSAAATAAKNAKAAKPNVKPVAAEKQTKFAMRPEIKNAKAKVNSLPSVRKAPGALPPMLNGPTAKAKESKGPLPVAPRHSGNDLPSRQTVIKRQKSDVTGLKMTSLHKEYMRSEKNAQRKQSANQVESKTSESDSASAVISNGDGGSEQTKIDMKIQTNRDFSKTIGDLYESIAHRSKAKRSPQVNGDTDGDSKLSSCDENEESQSQELDCDVHQRLLVEEQESLERQIRELESTEIDVDTETDETDCEVLLETDQDAEDLAKLEREGCSSHLFVAEAENGDLNLELHYEAFLMDMSWIEREECLRTLQAYVTRHPGRAQLLHQKLSSPSRRRSFHETLKKYQAKQARAQQKREMLQRDKANKIQQLLARVEDVKAAKAQLIEDKRLKMEERLQRAAENREQYLRQKIEKAHDEEKKLKEINFIKSLEAQNKRLDLIESTKDVEVRLQDLEQERQKRLEEKAAKEAAVERRRQELEKEFQRKLEKMNETRLEREQRIGKMQEQKELQRQALAREKARDREERLQALQAQKQQNTEELQRKILQKQKESARRHEENIEQIRQRAVELTIPNRNTEEVANGTMRDEEEATEAPGKGSSNDGEMSTSTVSEVGRNEHSRNYKKKLKKLRTRLAQGAAEYLAELEPVDPKTKRNSQVPKYLGLITKGGGPQGYERPLGQLNRLTAKGQVDDFLCFLNMDGLGIITNHVIMKGLEEHTEVPRKAVILAVQLYRNACTFCPQIARHALLGDSIVSMFEALGKSFQLREEKSAQQPVELTTEILLALSVAFATSHIKKQSHPKVVERLPDLISYAVRIGTIENLARRIQMIREPIEQQQSLTLSVLAILGMFTRFVDIHSTVGINSCNADPTLFFSVAKSTELFGVVSMLNACAVPVGECLPPRTISVAASAFNLLVSVSMHNPPLFQECLGAEPIAMKFMDVATILLRYVGINFQFHKHGDTTAVIIDLIATLSFYCVKNKKNTERILSEQCSLLIKSVTKLPSHYDVVVYPFLAVLMMQHPDGRKILEREYNIQILDEYLKSEAAKTNRVIKVAKSA